MEKLRYLPHLVLLLGGSVLVGACDGQEVSPTQFPDNSFGLVPVPTATVDIAATSMSVLGATVESRTPRQLAEMMSLLPRKLVDSASSISTVDALGTKIQGSGMVIDTDDDTGITVAVSAGHFYQPLTPEKFIISQPQNEISLEVSSQDMIMVCQQPDGICIFAFRHPDSGSLGNIGNENIEVNWTPLAGDEVYTLGFPTIVSPGTSERKYEVPLPAVFVFNGTTHTAYGVNLYESDVPSGPGYSGAVAVTDEGKVGGLILLGDSNRTEFYCWGNEIFEMTKFAQERLLERIQ